MFDIYRPPKTDYQIKAFISSKDILEDERSTVESVLLSLNIKAIRVETNHWFATPNSEEYLLQVEKSDIVILLIDLSSKANNNYYDYVKQEIDIAFKLGKPVLAFFKDKPGEANVTDNFIQETQYKLFHHRFKNCVELAVELRNSIYNELFQKYNDKPKLINSKRSLYKESSMLISSCNYNLFLSQYTPTFLLGARIGRQYEEELLERLKTVILNCNNCEIVLLYNRNATEIEISNNKNAYDLDAINSNIDFFSKILENNTNLFVVCSENDTLPFVVCDHSYILGSSVDSASLVVLDKNPKIASELIKQMDKFTAQKNDQGITEFIKLKNKYFTE